MNNALLTSVAAFALVSCSEPAPTAQDAFFGALTALCGQKYLAEVVEGDEGDDAWRDSKIIMYVAECSDEIIKIPLAVGENTSRTWIITRTGEGLSLKHDHRHEDGTPDDVSMYGGSTLAQGTANRQEFPADQYSKDLFLENGLDVSVDNTWVLMIKPGETFSYRLQRPGRTFQIDFDLTRPIK